jgi:cystathionine beta-lyase family protein involved in aluminum resistance
MEYLTVSPKIRDLASQAEADLAETFDGFERVAAVNTEKVMASFQKNRVSDGCFAGTTGYGYDDKRREVLDRIYADVFHCESGLVRIGFVNGTHAITAALFSALRPGDTLLSAAGVPYDTLQSVIGITGNYPLSLKYYGINYAQCDLTDDGKPDLKVIESAAADPKVKAVTIQRSRGYSSREAFTVEEIGGVIDVVRRVNPNAAIIVDNCYGEFVDVIEPTDVGADLMAGSLIKNPGGGLAPTGGYVVGRADLVDAVHLRGFAVRQRRHWQQRHDEHRRQQQRQDPFCFHGIELLSGAKNAHLLSLRQKMCSKPMQLPNPAPA